MASPVPIDPMALIDPELRPALEAALPALPAPGTADLGMLPAMRQAEQTDPLFLPAPEVAERLIPGPAGAPEVRVFVVNASPGAARPAILHFHRGGFVLGRAIDSVPALQAQASALDCVIVTVDYRLAPETPFPGPLKDTYAALAWLHAHADELGVDPKRIALQGESSGGGYAAMLAIAARDRGEVPVAFQALVYPMLDDRTGSTRELPAHIGAFLWTREFNRLGWTALLGVPAGSEQVPAGAVPARVGDLTGLPPTWIGVGAIDLFVDEDVEYARRLVLAGVPTELLVVPGSYHRFQDLAPDASVSQQFVFAQYNALARAFGRPPVDAP